MSFEYKDCGESNLCELMNRRSLEFHDFETQKKLLGPENWGFRADILVCFLCVCFWSNLLENYQ